MGRQAQRPVPPGLLPEGWRIALARRSFHKLVVPSVPSCSSWPSEVRQGYPEESAVSLGITLFIQVEYKTHAAMNASPPVEGESRRFNRTPRGGRGRADSPDKLESLTERP